MEQNPIYEKYIQLMETRQEDQKRFIELKDYNTALRIAIANIPLESKKAKATTQAVKKAKRLAQKEPSKIKKRKREESPEDETSTTSPEKKVKRTYVRKRAKKEKKYLLSESVGSEDELFGDDDETSSCLSDYDEKEKENKNKTMPTKDSGSKLTLSDSF